MRIDADILAWLQSSGAGYQTRLNQLLREAMQQAA
ncbi:MAG: BrnA antitoxin family protein [Candidatus Thiothrix sulfatifontis]|nr:MAG: BrnA antitoxin family protein [Candidatus Thiothrix sulfatifontis]